MRDALAMGWYPIAYIIEIFPISLVRFLSFRSGAHIGHGWTILAGVCFASSGMLNLLLWLLTGRQFGFTLSDEGSEEEEEEDEECGLESRLGDGDEDAAVVEGTSNGTATESLRDAASLQHIRLRRGGGGSSSAGILVDGRLVTEDGAEIILAPRPQSLRSSGKSSHKKNKSSSKHAHANNNNALQQQFPQHYYVPTNYVSPATVAAFPHEAAFARHELLPVSATPIGMAAGMSGSDDEEDLAGSSPEGANYPPRKQPYYGYGSGYGYGYGHYGAAQVENAGAYRDRYPTANAIGGARRVPASVGGSPAPVPAVPAIPSGAYPMTAYQIQAAQAAQALQAQQNMAPAPMRSRSRRTASSGEDESLGAPSSRRHHHHHHHHQLQPPQQQQQSSPRHNAQNPTTPPTPTSSIGVPPIPSITLPDAIQPLSTSTSTPPVPSLPSPHSAHPSSSSSTPTHPSLVPIPIPVGVAAGLPDGWAASGGGSDYGPYGPGPYGNGIPMTAVQHYHDAAAAFTRSLQYPAAAVGVGATSPGTGASWNADVPNPMVGLPPAQLQQQQHHQQYPQYQQQQRSASGGPGPSQMRAAYFGPGVTFSDPNTGAVSRGISLKPGSRPRTTSPTRTGSGSGRSGISASGASGSGSGSTSTSARVGPGHRSGSGRGEPRRSHSTPQEPYLPSPSQVVHESPRSIVVVPEAEAAGTPGADGAGAVAAPPPNVIDAGVLGSRGARGEVESSSDTPQPPTEPPPS